MYTVPEQKKNMVTMGFMDINSTCDDGKVSHNLYNIDIHSLLIFSINY